MHLKLGQITTIVISSSSTAKQVLQTDEKFFANRPSCDAANAYNHSQFGMPWLPASSLWRNLRKISNSHLFSAMVLDANMNLRHNKVRDLLNRVHKSAETGEAVDIGRAAFETILNLLSTAFFSVDLADSTSDIARELKETVWNLMEEVGKPNLADYFPLLRKLDPQGIRRRAAIYIRKFMDLFDRIVEERVRLRSEISTSDSTKDDDMLDALLNMMPISEYQLDKNQIEHLFLDLLVAGIETTSSALEWSIAELLKSPEIMSKANAELEQVIGKGNQVKESDITQLPYLQAIVKETLRLYPSIPLIPREAERDVQVCGYVIPKGAQVLVNAWAIGRDPTIWDNPNKFLPERFLESNIDIGGRSFEFIPFGGGRRLCPGLPLATRMLHLILASLLHSFTWKLEDGISPENMNMEDKFGLATQMAQPLRARPVAIIS
ncbi:hypothetical protein TIFTF001_021247 [Ficus carica]|nr:hypothetical protein TIFTF001_021247 [Ficus carica]